MYLKKLVESNMITIDYDRNGILQTFRGRVSHLNLSEQILSLKDEKQKIYCFRLSGIRRVY